jgi:hypothetical protein
MIEHVPLKVVQQLDRALVEEGTWRREAEKRADFYRHKCQIALKIIQGFEIGNGQKELIEEFRQGLDYGNTGAVSSPGGTDTKSEVYVRPSTGDEAFQMESI